LCRLIFFLHGSGEGEGKFCTGKTVSGAAYDLGLNTVDSVCYHGLPHKIEERPMSADFVVVSPQAPAAAGASWSDGEGVAIDALEDLAAAITEALAIDLERVYLTGLSMGGAGTWRWASTHPDHFAAIAPICGGLGGSDSEALRATPIWLFVGAEDGGAKRCDETAETMRALGAPIKYTVYPDAPAPFQPTDSSPERGPQAGHDSWSAAYADPTLYEWLLAHKLAVAGGEGAEGDDGAEDTAAGGIVGWVRGLFAKL
jgi:predicted peptidase